VINVERGDRPALGLGCLVSSRDLWRPLNYSVAGPRRFLPRICDEKCRWQWLPRRRNWKGRRFGGGGAFRADLRDRVRPPWAL